MRFFLAFSLMLSGCAGYRLSRGENPFRQYGVRSVSVPMFINRSGVAHVAPPLTREIVLALSKYRSLKVYSGYRRDADAVLLGVISSPGSRRDIFKATEHTLTEGDLRDSIGGREEFVTPAELSYGVALRLTLIRHPSSAERDFLAGPQGRYVRENERVLFNTILNLRGKYRPSVRETLGPDSPGIVNFTKSKKHFEDSVKELAENAAARFKDAVLDVF